MKTFLHSLLLVCILVIPLAAVFAQEPFPEPYTFTSAEQAQNWVEEINTELENNSGGRNLTSARIPDSPALPIEVLESCPLPTIERDPTTEGDIGINTVGIYRAYSCFDKESNTTWIRVGTSWWGSGDDQARIYGVILIRDADSDEIVDSLKIDKTNTPTQDGALFQDVSWPGPLDGQQYRYELEFNIRQLPCNNGPSAYTQSWLMTMNLGQIIVQKYGSYIEGTTFELWGRKDEKSQWEHIDSRQLAPWDVSSINGERVGQVDFIVPGPLVATWDNYKILERADLLPPGVTVTSPTSGFNLHRLDVAHPIVYSQFTNGRRATYLPLIPKGPITPPPAQPLCPLIQAKFKIETWEDTLPFSYSHAIGSLVNLRSYQSLNISFRLTDGTPVTLPNGGSRFTLNGQVLIDSGLGPFIKVYPSQLPLNKTSTFSAEFTDVNGETCSLERPIFDP